MDPGDILGRTWELYRSHLRHLVTIAAVVYVPMGVLAAVLLTAGWPGVLAANVFNMAALFLVQGAVVTTVADVRDGRRDLGVAETLAAAGRRLVPVAVAGVLATLGILLGLLLLIVPGLILLTWWLVISPVIMIEGMGVGAAFGRSRALVHGHAWPVFGVVVLTLLVLLALGLVVGLALSPLDGAPRGFLVTAIGNSLAAPFAGVAWTLTYFRLRDLSAGPTALAGGDRGYTAIP
jgi:hypothetical protein